MNIVICMILPMIFYYEIEDLADQIHKASRYISYSSDKLEEIDDRTIFD